MCCLSLLKVNSESEDLPLFLLIPLLWIRLVPLLYNRKHEKNKQQAPESIKNTVSLRTAKSAIFNSYHYCFSQDVNMPAVVMRTQKLIHGEKAQLETPEGCCQLSSQHSLHVCKPLIWESCLSILPQSCNSNQLYGRS